MGRMLFTAVLSISVAGLCACAGTPQRVSQAPPPAPSVDRPGAVVSDSEYIAYVERVARRRGIEVKWVNPPTKRVASR